MSSPANSLKWVVAVLRLLAISSLIIFHIESFVIFFFNYIKMGVLVTFQQKQKA
jgi:hypothetical protein